MSLMLAKPGNPSEAPASMDDWLKRQSARVAKPLFAPLYTRAKARQLWPEFGFRDEVAALLIERLGGVPEGYVVDGISERQCLIRSQWFDQRCRQFFDHHPKGLCIDLGAGLSTRFHRLSRSADWPRFRWVDLDVPEVTRLKAALLPKTDNYQLVSADLAVDDWLQVCGWQTGTPLIITMEGVLMHLPLPTVMRVFDQIARRCESNASTEIIFDYIKPLQLHCARLSGLFSRLMTSRETGCPRYLSALTNARQITRVLPCYTILSDKAMDMNDRRHPHRIALANGSLGNGAHMALGQG